MMRMTFYACLAILVISAIALGAAVQRGKINGQPDPLDIGIPAVMGTATALRMVLHYREAQRAVTERKGGVQ